MGRKSISGAAGQFRISFAKPLTWTPEKVDQLRSLASTHTISEAAAAIGMSFDSVQSACRKHTDRAETRPERIPSRRWRR
jgi:hypothetical protein